MLTDKSDVESEVIQLYIVPEKINQLIKQGRCTIFLSPFHVVERVNGERAAESPERLVCLQGPEEGHKETHHDKVCVLKVEVGERLRSLEALDKEAERIRRKES
jgi:hypothetical protein